MTIPAIGSGRLSFKTEKEFFDYCDQCAKAVRAAWVVDLATMPGERRARLFSGMRRWHSEAAIQRLRMDVLAEIDRRREARSPAKNQESELFA